MADPSLERLSRFTPDAGSLDRDALLFAAGRNSARPNRGWKTLAALLAGTQSLSLVLFWLPSPPRGSALLVADVPAPAAALESPTAQASVRPGLLSGRHGLREPETEGHPADDLTLIESGPPLRAFPLPSSLVN